MSPRDRRSAELRQIWIDDPTRIIGMYRHLMELDELGQLPKGSTFATIIEAILDHEEASGKLTNHPDSD